MVFKTAIVGTRRHHYMDGRIKEPSIDESMLVMNQILNSFEDVIAASFHYRKTAKHPNTHPAPSTYVVFPN